MAFEDEVREFFRRARESAIEGAAQLGARSRRAAIPRLQLAGRLGSPVQEFTFGEIERGTQEALAPQLAEIGQREAGTLAEFARIREEQRQAEIERQRQEEAARRARRRGLLASILQTVGTTALPFFIPGLGLGAKFALSGLGALSGAGGLALALGERERRKAAETSESEGLPALSAPRPSFPGVIETGVSDSDLAFLRRRPKFRRRLDISGLPEPF